MPDNSIDIKGGNNQILPNAEKAVQNIYYGDSAIKLALQRSEEPVENSTGDKNKISDTHSESVEHEQPLHDQKLKTADSGTTMKIAILHLSDLHMSSANADWLMKKINQIVAAVWNDYYDCGKIIIVVSGDIANAGTEEEYGYAKQFFRALLKEFAVRGLANKELENKIICVPGNHDCNFNKEDVARNMLLGGMRSNPTAVENSVYDSVSAVQN